MKVARSRSLKLRYLFDGVVSPGKVKFFPYTKIGLLINRIKADTNVSDITIFYGDEALDGAKTFSEYNIPSGVTLTVTRTLPSGTPSPEPEHK
jgi:hypothetical protein